MVMQIGPKSQAQLRRLATVWKQGEHLLVTGGTGSGKTLLARQLDEIRLQRGGAVIVFVAKLKPDDTIHDHYKGWTRWTTWKEHPGMMETRILFWPKVEKLSPKEATALMRREFEHAFEMIGKAGKWTVHIDEGLFTCSRDYLNLGSTVGLLYALMRSSKGTMVTLAQRPSHLPVAIYANLSHAFVGRASELPDLKRLADMDGLSSSRVLQKIIAANGRHDFTWIPISQDWPPERVNLKE